MTSQPVATPRPSTSAPASLSATAVQRLLSHDIRTPIAALRASLESLSARSSRDASTQQLAQQAIELLGRVEHATEILCDNACPREPAPVRCSVEEIARSALQCLRPEARAHALLALEDPEIVLSIDALLLARSLARIAEAVLSGGSHEILIHSQLGEGTLGFTIVSGLDPRRHHSLELSFDVSSEHVRHADVAIAVRDVRRLGGKVEMLRSARELACVQVEIPLSWKSEESR